MKDHRMIRFSLLKNLPLPILPLILLVGISPIAHSIEFQDLPVKSIPERSTLTFQKDLFLPANTDKVNILDSYDLNCYLEIYPTSNRSRIIRAGSIFYVSGASDNPPSIKIETKRNTIIHFECAPRMETVPGGEATTFFRSYSERINLNYGLSIQRFEKMFKNNFELSYSEPIEIEGNERTLKAWNKRNLPGIKKSKKPIKPQEKLIRIDPPTLP